LGSLNEGNAMKKTRESSKLSPVVRRFVEEAGNLTQSFGVGRVLGQIYAYLYFSREHRSLADMQEALGISKGSASMGVRQLEQWGAVRKVWVKGDRKDYYQGNDWFGNILKHAVVDTVGKKMASYTSLLDDIQSELPRLAADNGEGEFIKGRVEQLRSFQGRAQKFWNSRLLQRLLR
jgi:DNA-binding transcriptional regulator GbsR (MarR family)